MDHTILPNT